MITLGDILKDATISFLWQTNDSAGGAVTRTIDGEIRVYKDNQTSESTAGITDTEDFDSMTGIHCCTIDTSADAFYEAGHDYNVVLSGAGIDGQTVNAVLAHFSIENRNSFFTTIIGHLTAMKDGNAGDFDGTTDSLADLRDKMNTITGAAPIHIEHDNTFIARHDE